MNTDLGHALSELKSLPDTALQKELASPSGMIPDYLILGELHDRKNLRMGGNVDPGTTKPKSLASDYIGDVRQYMPSGQPPSFGPQQPGMPPMTPTLPMGGGMPPRGAPQGGISSLPPPVQGYASGGITTLGFANGGRVRLPPGMLGAMLRNESGGRNIPNTTQGTSSGQAQGYFQITTGTWKEFARQAGIDLNQYPTPMSAPYEVQHQVAGIIPVKRWDESTVARMRDAYGRLNSSATLGENIRAGGESFSDFSPGDKGGFGSYAQTAAAIDPTTTGSIGAAAAAPQVAAQAASTAQQMAAAEGAGGGGGMGDYFLMQMVMGEINKNTPQPPQMAQQQQQRPTTPFDPRQFVQDPSFMMRRSLTYG